MNRSLRPLRLPVTGCDYGEVVVASAFTDPGRGEVTCAAAPLLAAALGEGTSSAGTGPRVRLSRVLPVPPSARLKATAVLFGASYVGPDGTAGGFALTAHGGDPFTMAMAAQTVRQWMAVVRSRRLLLDETEPLCQGGRRAVRMIGEAAAGNEPLHVLGYPVAGQSAMGELRRLGVVCTDDLDAVPDGGRVAFPAHGTHLAARAAAVARGLRVVDATCPLVAAAQADAARYAGRGDLVVLIGRPGDAVVPPLAAHADGTVAVVATSADVSGLEPADADRVSFVIDPAMPVGEAMPVLAALRDRFPRLRGHHLDVICDHGSDRAQAIAAVAADSELMLIAAGSGDDGDAQTALRIAERAGSRPRVVQRLADVDPDLLAGATSVGLTATLGAPPRLTEEIAGVLSGLGPLTLSRRSVRTSPAMTFTTESRRTALQGAAGG